MKGLEKIFAQAFDEEAKKRGFKITEKPSFGVNAIYGNSDWEIGSIMSTMFRDTTVRIVFTPINPIPEISKQQLIRCAATWSDEHEKWILQERHYTNNELIEFAFEQLEQQ